VKSLIVYRHDTGQQETHRWPLPRLLLMLQHYRPRPGERDSDRSFVVGPKDSWLMIGTAGTRWFEGQRPVHDARGRFAGVMLYDRLSAQAAERILKRFYAGWPAARCFRPRTGWFQPYPSSSAGRGTR
jgi:hypothetical protein